MPKLLEYQGKGLLREQGVPVPEGEVVATPQEAGKIAARIAKPVAIKAQIGATGRFKAGGIKFADTADEAEKAANDLLGKEIKGIRVEKVLIEERLDVEKELYAGIIVDDSYKVKGPVLMFSTQGGVDIEEVAAESPDMVVSININVLDGITVKDTRELFQNLIFPCH